LGERGVSPPPLNSDLLRTMVSIIDISGTMKLVYFDERVLINQCVHQKVKLALVAKERGRM
jgi:hypothetical protein